MFAVAKKSMNSEKLSRQGLTPLSVPGALMKRRTAIGRRLPSKLTRARPVTLVESRPTARPNVYGIVLRIATRTEPPEIRIPSMTWVAEPAWPDSYTSLPLPGGRDGVMPLGGIVKLRERTASASVRAASSVPPRTRTLPAASAAASAAFWRKRRSV